MVRVNEQEIDYEYGEEREDSFLIVLFSDKSKHRNSRRDDGMTEV